MALDEQRTWWKAGRRFSTGEVVADGMVHGIGIAGSLAAGATLIVLAAFKTTPSEVAAVSVYVATLLTVFTVSLAYNMWPASPVKRALARLDQAAIFLFIAGSYTPFLILLGGSTVGTLMLAIIWSAAMCGVALKLFFPQSFGHFAILLYMAVGGSGIFIFHAFVEALPMPALWLLAAGGVTYTAGIIFHLWEKLRFQTAVWHGFVVIAAMLHFGAVLDAMVLSRG